MTVSGWVKDAVTMEPIGSATISTYISGGVQIPIGITGADGRFSVEDKNMGLVISSVDYLPVFIPLPHTAGLTYKLTRDYESLPGITITASKKGLFWLAALFLLFSLKK